MWVVGSHDMDVHTLTPQTCDDQVTWQKGTEAANLIRLVDLFKIKS